MTNVKSLKIRSWLARHRRQLICVGLSLLLLYLCLPWLLTTLARQLIRDDDARAKTPVDLIVALGGSIHCERELQAAELFKQGRGAYLSVSGVTLGAYGHLADSLQRTVITAGVPSERVITIRDQFNTRTEARLIIQTMRQRGWRRALVVTSGFHSRRALYTFEREARDLEFFSLPVASGSAEWSPTRWWSRRRDALLTVREFLSWVNTGMRGWE